jgi:hypothetical protein
MARANVDASAYVDVPGFARTVRTFDGGRFLALGPAGADRVTQLREPAFSALLTNQRATLFGLQDVEGYNPSQLPRYWTFVRAVDPRPMRYNAASIRRLDTAVRDLLQVEWVTAPASRAPPAPGAVAVDRDGRWVLYRLSDTPERASVFTSWTGVAGEREALDLVTASGFEPDRDVVVEGLGTQPGSGTSPAGTVRFTATGLGSATIEVVAPAAAIVLVRIPYAAHWQASVDDRPVAVVPADYLLQAVPVGPGTHRIELRYEDPTIGGALACSTVVLLALVIGSMALRRAGRRGSRESGTTEEGNR